MLPERIDPLVGSILGDVYRVLEPIGIGGMSVVYLVEHQTLLKRFAAKVLSSNLASSLEARARFTQEAHAASQLDHENIVSISDLGVTVDHRPFFVMELLRGQTLEQRLAEGPMALEEVVAVSVPVARALAHAHAEGIVHRDIKPENIFLVQRSQGRWGVKVVDFGIAKTPINPRLTKMGETLGSPMFMSPEMCRGDDDDVDQRADVYSFGVLLYLMLCGRLPFEDDSMLRVLQMHLVEPPPPPRQVNPQLSAELAAVVERALAKRPDDRYPSMDALLLDLEAALPGGADRLLIEAQSGTALRETAFAGMLSIGRQESQRLARVLPAASSGQLATPRGRSRRRAPIVLAAGIACALAGGLVWWRLSGGANGAGPAASSVPVATAAVRSPPQEIAVHAGAAVPPQESPAPANDDRPGAVTAEPAGVTAVAEDTIAAVAAPPEVRPGAVPAPVASEDTVAAVAPPPEVHPAAAPARPVIRPRPALRREPRPVKRAAVIAPAPPVTAVPVAPAGATTASAVVLPPDGPGGPATAPPGEAIAAPPAVPQPPPAAVPARPPAPPRPAAPGALDATPSVVSLEVKGSLSPSIVRRSVERTLTALRGCYRAAARAGQAAPAVDLRMSFEIDENSLATHVATDAASFGSLASCAAAVAGQIRSPEAPDVGTAQVTVVIRFRPT